MLFYCVDVERNQAAKKSCIEAKKFMGAIKFSQVAVIAWQLILNADTISIFLDNLF